MKKILIVLILISTYSYSQNGLNRLQELETAQKDVKEFWEDFYKKYNRPFTPPNFIYTNGQYNVFYSGATKQIITSVDLVKDVFDKYGNTIIYFIYAHEFGHFIQDDTNNSSLLSSIREYKADCIAGIYFNKLSKDNRLESDDFSKIIAFLKDTEDTGSTTLKTIILDDHGTADGRIKAFSEGFKNNSLKFCLTNFKSL